MMKSRIFAFLVCLLFSCITGGRLFGQASLEFRNPGNDSVKTVFILHDTVYRFVQIDSATSVIYLVGNVILREDRTMIYCDSMLRNSKDNFIEAFGHVKIFDGDSTTITSDYMKYQAVSKNVLFRKNVRLTDGKGVLTTQELQYDLNTKLGVYTNGGKVVNNGSVLTSEEATYYGDTKDVLFRKKVVLRDPQYDLASDSLLYNTQTQVSHFITETFIQFKDSTQRTVRTHEGFYDLRNHHAEFGSRPVITDGSQRITGDSVAIDDASGISVAKGNAVYADTAEGVSFVGGYLYNDQKNHFFRAIDKPVMILKQEKDSIYIAADSFYSGRLVDEEAAQRVQARLDSLHRHFVDSMNQRAQDSLHRLFANNAHPSGIDTVETPGDSSRHILVRDESRPMRDSTGAPIADSAGKAGSQGTDTTNRLIQVEPPRVGKDSAREQPPGSIPGRKPTSHRRTNIYNDDGRIASGRAAEASDTATDRPTTDTTLRYIRAYHGVRIFSDSLQAVADSMYYSSKDSIFRLYKDPVAWGSGNNQIAGDTMYLYTRNKKADRIYVFENALAINKVGPNFYNQIRGNTINGYFKDGQMDFMRAKGNAESIYYLEDDNKAFSGVNRAHADVIDMIFKEKELDRVVFRSDGEGSMIPWKKVVFDDMRLRGFKWQDDRRPKSKTELLSPAVLAQIRKMLEAPKE